MCMIKACTRWARKHLAVLLLLATLCKVNITCRKLTSHNTPYPLSGPTCFASLRHFEGAAARGPTAVVERHPDEEAVRHRPAHRAWNGTGDASFKVGPRYLQLIAQGLKTVEARIMSGRFRAMKRGDRITFKTEGEELACTIRSLHFYESIREMLEVEGVKNCLPDVKDIDEGVDIYHSLPDWEKRAKRRGVVAVRLKLL